MRGLAGVLLFAAVAAAPMVAKAADMDTIKKRGVFEVCAHPDALPFSAEGAGTDGLHLDLARTMAREMDVDLRVSWISYRYQAKYTRCDAFMGVSAAPGGDSPLKKTKPVMQVEMLAVSKPERDVRTLEALAGLRVATPSGSLVHAALLDQPVELVVRHLRADRILEAVASGEADLGIVSNIELAWYRKRHPDVAFRSESSSFIDPAGNYALAIGFRKADQQTVDQANEILDRLERSGELSAIYEKYGIAADGTIGLAD